jgi:hypothetical protein
MEGYTQSEYHEFLEEDDEEEEEEEDWKKKKKIQYSTILKEEDFIED